LLSPSAAVRADTTTFAPSIASLTAIASPIPRLAPVTSAVLPRKVPFGFTRVIPASHTVLSVIRTLARPEPEGKREPLGQLC
jgi:hypothetical protein